MNLWFVFLTGLTSGGVTCAAMQGGILASTIANQKRAEGKKVESDAAPNSFDVGDWGPVSAFLSAKLIIHVILGFFLGWLGPLLPSPSACAYSSRFCCPLYVCLGYEFTRSASHFPLCRDCPAQICPQINQNNTT
jgi:hypothetical protein